VACSEVNRIVHHSDRGCQYLSIRYLERLTEAGFKPSIVSVVDSYDNALAESIIEMFKPRLFIAVALGENSTMLSM
jgi:transposase InsO family protein